MFFYLPLYNIFNVLNSNFCTSIKNFFYSWPYRELKRFCKQHGTAKHITGILHGAHLNFRALLCFLNLRS